MKYKIEGNFNFFEELYKSLDEDSNLDNMEDVCLISGDPLIDNFVTLKCGHKFNYTPLFNDISLHKLKFNSLESANKLKTNEIRCPYCRNKQTEMLPYYEDMGVEKINGVNFYCSLIPTTKYGTTPYKSKKYSRCEYQKKNPKYNKCEPENENNLKLKQCSYNGTNLNEPGCSGYYCGTHRNVAIKNYQLAEAKKIKEEAKKIKEEKFIQKNIKEPKEKVKGDKNVVVSSSIEIQKDSKSGCVAILKTGPNKGTSCNNTVYKDGLCKRHGNTITNKNITNNVIENNSDENSDKNIITKIDINIK